MSDFIIAKGPDFNGGHEIKGYPELRKETRLGLMGPQSSDTARVALKEKYVVVVVNGSWLTVTEKSSIVNLLK